MKSIIILSGYNNRSIYAFLRTISNTKISFGIIANGNEDEIFQTNYKKYVYSTRSKDLLTKKEFLKCFLELKKKLRFKRFLLAPSTEYLNRFALKEKKFFNKLKIEIPLVREKTYKSISDKKKFFDLCKKERILCPKTINKVSNLSFPCFAKPKKFFYKNTKNFKPIMLRNMDEYKNFVSRYNLNDFFLQKNIDGKSFYLLYYFHRNGKVLKLSMKNILQQPNGGSILASKISFVHNNFVSKKFVKLFKKISFYGLVMVEIIKFKKKFYMIEANPRFWGPSQLFVDSNINLFSAFLNDYLDADIKINCSGLNKNAKYFWLQGILDVNKAVDCKCYLEKNEYKKFKLELKEYIKSDVYLRSDTKRIKNYK